MHLLGVDFTSAPRRAKPITVAHGRLDGERVVLEALETIADWPAFETLLRRPGPWLAALDFPFSLPRAGITAMGWPSAHWAALVRHVAAMDKPAFRAALDADRQRRPMGARYPHRRTDRPAGSHSPMKLVNPPVGLMFFEGAPRLLAAGVHVPGVHDGDAQRVAVEAYPGLLARAVTRASYKSDTRARQSPERAQTRGRIVTALEAGTALADLPLRLEAAHRQALLADGSGDLLDATLALVQAAWCARRRSARYGCPPDADPLEGWIATV
ncbi:DUF429 domain-containing protein [Nitrogeniibacter mangrovi]|uniref:DUF429 domain-containing protein n=1 Tax=Nitrogeniibacter mangrovi TaxID=2016596 RepID=A0A6C1B1G2_9RHOO|nr:DUF429 domain-containing protein [Nitrogeniibacter mangrovi]QID17466.1 DUF429 domain-containing protein [Nitrogeniibacter mangrovi]